LCALPVDVRPALGEMRRARLALRPLFNGLQWAVIYARSLAAAARKTFCAPLPLPLAPKPAQLNAGQILWARGRKDGQERAAKSGAASAD